METICMDLKSELGVNNVKSGKGIYQEKSQINENTYFA